MIARIGMLVVAALAGAFYGVVGTIAHGVTMWTVPVGLILGLVGAAALLLAIRLLTDRRSATAAGAGMTIAIMVFSGEGPGGSVIAPAGLPAMVWTIACPLLAVVVALWPRLSRPDSGPSSAA